MNELEIAEIYVDESSQTKNRFLLIGGIIIPSSDVAAASEAIKQARLPELPYGEMKWGKVSKAKYEGAFSLFNCGYASIESRPI
jgi:hypothetical protein